MVKRAVCVGIDVYADRTIPRLSGCVADARAMAAMLVQRFGHAESDVKLLLDDRATRESILRALDWMLMLSTAGDTLLLYVAGYGTVVPDREAPGELDEVVVAHDHDAQFSQLRDDELAKRLRRLPAGVLGAVVLDTGRLGALTPPAAPALYGAPWPVQGRFLEPPNVPPLNALRTQPLPLSPRLRARRADDPTYVAVFACGEGEVARESSQGGAFTAALLEVLRGEPQVTWAEAVRRTTARMRASGSQQTPSCVVPGPLEAVAVMGGATAPPAAAPTGYGPPGATGYGPPGAPGYTPVGAGGYGAPPGSGGAGTTGIVTSAGGPAQGATYQANASPVASTYGTLAAGGAAMVAGAAMAGAPLVAPVVGSNPIDAMLGQFAPTDATVKLCSKLLSVLPGAPGLMSYRSLDEAISVLYPRADASVAQRARALAASEGVASAMRAFGLVDTADTGLAVFSGMKGAVGLIRGQGSAALETDRQQGIDATLKLLAIAYGIYHLYPGPLPSRIQMFHMTPAGQQLAMVYAAVDVALPFADNVATGAGQLLGSLLQRYGGEAAGKLGAVGGASVGEAQGVVSSLLAPLEGMVQRVAPHARSAASAVTGFLPGAMNVADKAAGAVATGVDVLPLYRYLGARAAAEACVLLASRGM